MFLSIYFGIFVKDGYTFGAFFNILSYTCCGHISFDLDRNLLASWDTCFLSHTVASLDIFNPTFKLLFSNKKCSLKC